MRALALVLLTAVTMTQLGASAPTPDLQAIAGMVIPSTESRETIVRVGDRKFRVRVYLLWSLPGTVPDNAPPPYGILYTTVAVQPADGKPMPLNFKVPKVTFQHGRRKHTPILYENVYAMIWPGPSGVYSGTVDARLPLGSLLPTKIELNFGKKRGTAQVEGIIVRAASPTL